MRRKSCANKENITMAFRSDSPQNDTSPASIKEDTKVSAELDEKMKTATFQSTFQDGDDKGKNVQSTEKSSNLKLPTLAKTENDFPDFPVSINIANQFQPELMRSLVQSRFYNINSLLSNRGIMEAKDTTSNLDSNHAIQTNNKAIDTNNNVSSLDDLILNKEQKELREQYIRQLSETYAKPSTTSEMGGDNSELSASELAESILSNDAASMVFRRNKKYTGKSAKRLSSPHHTSLATTRGDNQENKKALSGSDSGNVSTLHYFTTRYTIETPTDPSRLGVELVLDHDRGEPFIEVECGGNRGFLYVNKLCQGSKGQSILFNKEWLTPNEFQFVSGRETAKDWKRSIRHCGKSLKTLMTKGILQVHLPVCECPQCREQHDDASMKNIPTSSRTPVKGQESFTNEEFNSEMDSDDASINNRNGSLDKSRLNKSKDGGLNMIISQLHSRANQPPSTSCDVIDLSPSDSKDDAITPQSSRKRPLDSNDIEEEALNLHKKTQSPLQNNSSTGEKSDFNGTFPSFPQDDQYNVNNMMKLLQQSLTPIERQRQMYAHIMNTFSATQFINNKDDAKIPQNSSNFGNNTERFGERKRKRFFEPLSQKTRSSQNSNKLLRQDEIFKPKRPPSNDVTLPTLPTNFPPTWPLLSGWNQAAFGAGKNIPFFSGFPELSDPLNKLPKTNSPITTMHHRPSAPPREDKKSVKPDDNFNRFADLSDLTNNSNKKHGRRSETTPMVVLGNHKRDVPMMSLTYTNKNKPSTEPQNDFNKILQPNLLNHDFARRGSFSAPPPPCDNENIERHERPTSALSKSFTYFENQPTQFQNDVNNNNLPLKFTKNSQETSSQNLFQHSKSRENNNTQLHRKNSEAEDSLLDSIQYLSKWTVEDVCDYVSGMGDVYKQYTKAFRENFIDGRALILLSERHLVEILGLKLGHALNVISRVREKLGVLQELLRCCHSHETSALLASTKLFKPDFPGRSFNFLPKNSDSTVNDDKL